MQRETTGRNAAAQVRLNVLMVALGGGAGVSTFRKDDLAGEPIEGVDRSNLANPVSTGFVQSLQEAVSVHLDLKVLVLKKLRLVVGVKLTALQTIIKLL